MKTPLGDDAATSGTQLDHALASSSKSMFINCSTCIQNTRPNYNIPIVHTCHIALSQKSKLLLGIYILLHMSYVQNWVLVPLPTPHPPYPYTMSRAWGVCTVAKKGHSKTSTWFGQGFEAKNSWCMLVYGCGWWKWIYSHFLWHTEVNLMRPDLRMNIYLARDTIRRGEGGLDGINTVLMSLWLSVATEAPIQVTTPCHTIKSLALIQSWHDFCTNSTYPGLSLVCVRKCSLCCNELGIGGSSKWGIGAYVVTETLLAHWCKRDTVWYIAFLVVSIGIGRQIHM